MKLTIRIIIFLYFLFFLSEKIYSVPIPEEKHDIDGVISEVKWYPSKFIRGIPGMSGSAGQDRIMPEHYIIKLINYEGISSEDALRITRYIKWDAFNDNENKKTAFILLKLNHKKKYYLKKGMKIKVLGYTVRGDEGGTYTYYEKIEILDSDRH